MEKLYFLGIGPKIGTVFLPWLAASIIISSIKRNIFIYISGGSKILLLTGIIMITIGLVLYFSTVILLLNGLKEGRLVTKGAYRICQNPLYAAIMLLIIPALSLILNSWLVLTASLVGYAMFKIFIKHEYAELEKLFGEDYLKYRNETPEFFPCRCKKRSS